MLANLIRITRVARMLECSAPTCASWARAAGLELIRAPVVGLGRTGAANSPLYLTCTDAVTLIDRMLPARVDRLANARARRLLRSDARRLEDSTRNIRHQVGGTGADTPQQKPAL